MRAGQRRSERPSSDSGSLPRDISADFYCLSTLSRQAGDSIESVDLQGQLGLVSTARGAGVRRFVFVSFPDDPTVQYPLTQAKRSVERAIADIDFTSIQASYFMEVWLTPAGSALTTFMGG